MTHGAKWGIQVPRLLNPVDQVALLEEAAPRDLLKIILKIIIWRSSPPPLIGNLARLGPTSGSRSPYRVWPKMTQRFGRSTLVNCWCCCKGENDEIMRENQHDENMLTQQSQYPFSFCLQRMSSGYPAIVKTHLLLHEVLEDHKIQIKVPSHLSFQTVSLHSQRRQFAPPRSRSECRCASKPEKDMTTTCKLTNHVVAPSTISESKPAVASGFFLCWPKPNLTGEKQNLCKYMAVAKNTAFTSIWDL